MLGVVRKKFYTMPYQPMVTLDGFMLKLMCFIYAHNCNLLHKVQVELVLDWSRQGVPAVNDVLTHCRRVQQGACGFQQQVVIFPQSAHGV
jgi:hypothetical protein